MTSYHWRLEVRIFVNETEGIDNEDRVEALYIIDIIYGHDTIAIL